ncbi:O-antigen ligase family protein [Hyalangium gracile]|uniref:O-antigen ligase family protein n=1 Tax=Hyalangium gracile TaxID=394092 RepID=UPI001CCE4E7A|nr:O-antigen ligase family protein [Hyalangium gracile]
MSPRALRVPGARAAAGFVLFVHLALSPLVFSHATTEHFELNKVALLLLAVLVLAALGAVQVPVRALGRDWLSLGVVLFAGSALASTLGSISRRTSLLGYPDCFAGLPTVLACAGLFFATRAASRHPDTARRLLLAPVFGAALAAAYAVLQLLGLDPMPWTRAASFAEAVRPFSTLSHPNFLGAYLAMTLPLGVVLGARARGLARAPFVLTGLLSVVAIAASLSRAAWAALAVALLVLGVGALRLWGRGTVLRWAVGLGTLLGGLAALLLLLPRHGELPALVSERVRHISDPGARHFIWRAAWNIFLEHPLLGCGLDAFALAFQRHREPAYWLLEWATTPYRAHSDVLHVLATQGLVGLGAVLVLGVGLGRSAMRTWRQAAREDLALVLALLAGLAAFFVQGLVGFTVTATGALFFTFAGVLSGLEPPGAEEQTSVSVAPAPWSSAALALAVFAYNFLGGPWSRRETGPGPFPALLVLVGVMAWMLFGVLRAAPPLTHSTAAFPLSPSRHRWIHVSAWAVALGAVYLLVLRPYRASLAAHEGDLLLPGAPEQAVAAYQRAVALDSQRDLYFVRLGTALQHAAVRASNPTERTRLLSRALESFQRAVSLVPADARHRSDLGAMLTEFAALKLATPAQAYAAFDEALARDPHDATLHVRAANAALRLGDLPTARRHASRAAELYPRFGPPRAQLGYLALTEGQAEEATRLLREALEGDWHGDTAAWVAASGNLATALLALGRTEEARQAASATVVEAPESVDARLVLGRVLEQVGAREEALEQYQRILALQPEHASAREALRRLGVSSDPP